MSKYKKLIFIFAIALLLNSCGGAKDFLTNTKKPAGDEFLVEKKQPLTMPPNFEDIPVPITDEERTSEINETDQVEIEELLKELEGGTLKNTLQTILIIQIRLLSIMQ